MSFKIRANRIKNEYRYRTVTFAVCSLIFNLMFAFYNGILGILNNSLWFGATCLYYLLLIAMRFSAVLGSWKKNKITEYAVMSTGGVLLTVLSVLLGFILYISLEQNTATAHGEIVMITIATYTFTKLIFAIVRAAKNRGRPSALLKTIRTVSYAEMAVSILSMQQSMLVSFGNTDVNNAFFLNMFTGVTVCLFILVLGIVLIKGAIYNGKIENSQSK